MSELTSLTLAQARDLLRKREFSAVELTKAHLAAIREARALNAFVLETPEQAHEMAARADAALATGEGGPLAGVPLGVKDMFATKGVRTTACSHMLDTFVPTYESTVTANLWRAGAVMLGKLNNDEFAMGSSNETSYFGPVVSPWRRKGSDVKLVPGGSSGGSSAAARSAPTPAARSASRQRSPASSASSPRMGAVRASASWRMRPRSIRRARSPALCATPPSCWPRWPATTIRTRRRSMWRCPITRRR